MRGILLAGGVGSRLWPATAVISKQLLPVAGRPMCLYPLCTLMEAGIREVCVITMPADAQRFHGLLGTGKKWGMNIDYCEQDEPRGLAEAFIIAAVFIGEQPVALILGDNLFLGIREMVASEAHRGGPCSFITRVAHPERYGVISFDKYGRPASIKEKPARPTSNEAITGLYLCAPSVIEIAKSLRPSKRGELEITGVLSEYLRRGQLRAVKLPPSATWMDCGTPEDLMEATNLIHALEKRTGDVIGSPEITSLRNGWITQEQFDELVSAMPACQYRESLDRFCKSANSEIRRRIK